MPNSHLFLWLNERQTGPYTDEQIRRMLAQRSIVAETLAWKEGMAEWLPLTNLSAPGSRDQKIKFACPRCQEKLEAPCNQAGTTFTCPICWYGVTVPQFDLLEAVRGHSHSQAVT